MSRYINSHFREKLDAAKIRQYTLLAIDRAKQKRSIVSVVFAVLKRFEGKTINKRFETAVKKELPESYIVSLQTTNLFIWGGPHTTLNTPLGYNERLSIYIDYTVSDGFDFDKFMTDTGNAQNQYDERIAQYEAGLENIDTLVNDYNNALKRLEAASENLKLLACE